MSEKEEKAVETKKVETPKEEKKEVKKTSLADKLGVHEDVVKFVKAHLKTDDEEILEAHIKTHYETEQ